MVVVVWWCLCGDCGQRQNYLLSARALLAGKFLHVLKVLRVDYNTEDFHSVWKVSSFSGTFSGLSGMLSRLSGKFSRLSEKFSRLSSFQFIWKV